MERVSVIVPVYQVEAYLKECVDALLRQTYENLEIILIDDGSKDQSGAICDAYAGRDQRIKVIHKKNAGLGYARNSGLEMATGDYITFIDSDDVAEPDLVERLMRGMKQHGADTCIGGFKRIDQDGNIAFVEEYEEKTYVGKEVFDGLFARMLGSAPDRHDAVRMSVWNVMYSAKIINAHHLRFPSEREFISEDIIWDSDYYQHAQCVQVISSSAYRYRITTGSLTQKYKPQRLEMSCKLYEEMERRFNRDREKITRLQRQFFVNLRVCIKQERLRDAQQGGKGLRKRIMRIVNHTTVQRVVHEYPIEKIQVKQRFFLMMIRYKLATVMLVLLKLNMV